MRSELGGVRLSARDVIETLRAGHPHAVEETYLQLIDTALGAHSYVYVDDFDLGAIPTRMPNAYPRPFFLQAVLAATAETARERGRHVLFAQSSSLYEQFEARGSVVSIPPFEARDYAAVVEALVGSAQASDIDFAHVFRSASRLNAIQLTQACALLRNGDALTTDAFIATIDERLLHSNVSLAEVAPVVFSDLAGAEELLQSLETNVVFPLENGALVRELGIRPRRGVLLHGPPGTGKTSIGRALAHRMRGKFFMVDGTVITEPASAFFSRLRAIFERAKENSPAVIFIDDADVLFQTDHVFGLNRYLLTMLDGLESETTAKVCVILTAMNVEHLPAALIRSGRIELWLETRLPDARARSAILHRHLAARADLFALEDVENALGLADGFTGADLKRLVSDATILYAYGVSRRGTAAVETNYLEPAARVIRKNKDVCAQFAPTRRSGTPAS